MDWRRFVRDLLIFLRSPLVGALMIAGDLAVSLVMTSLESLGMVMVMTDDE